MANTTQNVRAERDRHSVKPVTKPMAPHTNGKNHPDQVAASHDPTARLIKLLKGRQGEHHVVVIHAFPDPDAISSAYAHRLISAQLGVKVDIIYTGVISHRQNVALVKLLELEITPYDASMNLRQYDAAVFVDNQATTSVDVTEALEKAGVPVLVVVDHHEQQKVLEAEFTDIRPIGSTATIYAQYLERGAIKMDKSQRDHVIASTALMHGIMSDTGGFVRAGPEDFQAASYLSRFMDADLLDQIMSQSRPRQTMDIIHQALGSRVIAENFSVAGVGYLREDDRDAISQTSAFLLTEENVHTALAYGIMVGDDGRERLVGSLRTSRPIQNADELIKDVFGKDEAGRFYGGGRRTAAGFEIPVGFLSGDGRDEYRQLKWQVYDTQVKHKLFARIGVERPAKDVQAIPSRR